MINFLALLLLALKVSAQGSSPRQIPSSLCGNGIVDPGEDCDYLNPQTSSGCCDFNCKFRPANSPCASGTGICFNNGQCQTRSSLCASRNSVVYQLSSPINGETGIQGPYSACFQNKNNSASSSNNIKDLIQNNAAPGTSVLGQLLPDYYLAQSTCNKACQGTGISTQRPFCISFNEFVGIEQYVPDNFGCLVDKTATTKFGNAFNVASDTSSKNRTSAYNEMLQPGVCQAGVCRAALNCRNSMCSGNGECVMSSTAVSYLDAAFGITTSSSSNGAPSFDSGSGALVQCSCDDGWGGAFCDGRTTPNTNNSSQQNSPDSNDPRSIPYNTFVIAMVAATCGTFALMLLLFTIVYFWKRGDDIATDEEYYDYAIEEKKLGNGDEEFGNGGGVIAKRIDVIDSAEDLASSPIQPPPAIIAAVPSEENGGNQALYQNGYKDSNVMLPANYLRAAHAYTPRLVDEIQLLQGDILYLIKAFDDGWAKAYNLRSGKEGIFPLSFTKRIVVKSPETMNLPENPENQGFDPEFDSEKEPSKSDRRSSLHSE